MSINIGKYKIKNWIVALLFIFALSLIGFGISILVGSSIPFWILFEFSLIYSIEKWFGYITRKYKIIGKSYRILLNLSILSLFGLVVWTGIHLFSKQFVGSSLVGSLVFIAKIIFFIWMCRVVSKNSWRWPSMKLTAFSALCLLIIFAFAGVEPISEYKDTALNGISNAFSVVKNGILNKSSGGVNSDNTGTTNKETISSKLKVVTLEKYWEIVLKKCSISGNKVAVNVSIISHWNTPRYFGGDALSPYTFICIDQYGKIFEDAIEERKNAEQWQNLLEGKISITDEPEIVNFYKGEYYPEETRTGELEFIVNPKSGDVALYLGRYVLYTSKLKLFDLGTVK